MYEHFTDGARKIMYRANTEAAGWGHKYIAPEHLLMALLKEDSGVARDALTIPYVNPATVAEHLWGEMISGPESITGDRLPDDCFTEMVIQAAIDSARDLGRNYVGEEHLLLGLLRVEDTLAHRVLASYGLTTAKVIAAIRSVLKTPATKGTAQVTEPVSVVTPPVHVYFAGLGYLSPREDCTGQEAVLLCMLLTQQRGIVQVDYRGFVEKHNLARHFTNYQQAQIAPH